MPHYARSFCFILCLLGLPAIAGELFEDLSLQHGVELSAVTSHSTPLALGPILQRDDSKAPAWRLAQWGTRYTLEGVSPTLSEDGTRAMENPGKRIVLHPGGLAAAGVTLSVLGGEEYGRKLRKSGESWPHLLLEQRFEGGITMADFSQMDFSLDFRVLRCEVATSEIVSPDLHTGHITAFFAVRNKNATSTDFNDMIWFGLPLFDKRFDLPPGHQAVDGGKEDGTGKFICTLPGSRFYTGATGDGAWHTLRGDLVPLLQEALAASQSKGFLLDTTYADLQATSFNVGWEVPGPYDGEITLKGLSLMGVATRE